MAKIEDLSPIAYATELHAGMVVRSVGWLGGEPPRTGPAPTGLAEMLRYYRELTFRSDDDLGCHVCEMCDAARGKGEFWVEWAGIRYVLPQLVLHYIERHRYLPPDEFLLALAARWEADMGEGPG